MEAGEVRLHWVQPVPARHSQAAAPRHPTSDHALWPLTLAQPLCVPLHTRARGWSPGGPGAALSCPHPSHTAAACSSTEFLGRGHSGHQGGLAVGDLPGSVASLSASQARPHSSQAAKPGCYTPTCASGWWPPIPLGNCTYCVQWPHYLTSPR